MLAYRRTGVTMVTPDALWRQFGLLCRPAFELMHHVPWTRLTVPAIAGRLSEVLGRARTTACLAYLRVVAERDCSNCRLSASFSRRSRVFSSSVLVRAAILSRDSASN